MGSSIGKDKGEDTVDGGLLVPQGVYKGPQDWDDRIVRKLIIERKLAPFYKGLSDYDESWDEVTLTTHNLPRNGETRKASLTGEANTSTNREAKRSVTPQSQTGTGKGKDTSSARSLEAQLYRGAVECPICFLYYPRNINHSRCCDQPICTECFVQIKRPENGSLGANNSPAVCPFCVEPNFGVCYRSPAFSAGIGASDTFGVASSSNSLYTSSSSISLDQQDGKNRRKSVSHKNSEVVTSDSIRPDRILQPPRSQHTRRPPPSTLNNITPRRSTVRLGGGTFAPSPSRRNIAPGEADYFATIRSMGTDLEELMVMEAIRLSLLEQEERERRERVRNENENSNSNDNTSEVIVGTPSGSARGSVDQSSQNLSQGIIVSSSIDEDDDDDMDEDEDENLSNVHSQDNITGTTMPTSITEEGTMITSTHHGNIGGSTAAASSTSNVLSPFGHTNDNPPPIEQDISGGQASANSDVKKTPVIILSSNTIAVERDSDSGDSRGGSWEPA